MSEKKFPFDFMKAVENETNNTAEVRVNIVSGGAGNGAILDGADSGIKATVKDLTNSNPVTVAIVDGSGDQITSFGGGTQYTEDAAAAANPVGTALNLIRTDTPTGRTTADGDNVAACGTDKGELYVKHTDSIAVTNAGLTELAAAIDTEVQCDIVGALPAGTNNIGDVDVLSSALPTGAATSAKQDTQITAEQAIQTAVELIDNTVAVLGTATYTEAATSGLVIGAVRRDADTTLVNTTNEVAPLQVDANGRLKVEAFSGETLPVSLTSTTITGTVAVTQSGTWDEVGINDSGNSITVDNPQLSVVGGGVEAAAMRVTIANDSTGVLSVDDNGSSLTVDGTVDVTNTGTFAVQVDGAALTSLQLLDDAISGTEMQVDVVGSLPAGTNNIGDVDIVSGTITTVTTLTGGGIAHDGVDSGNPHKIGARATNAEIAAVANNDRSDLVSTLTGKLITHPYTNPENIVSGAITSAMTGTTSTSLVAAPGAGLRNYITTIIVSNAHATVGTDVAIQDGSGGTTLLTIPAAAVYGGAVITLPVPLRQPTANTALFCANVTTGASTKVSAVGYKAA